MADTIGSLTFKTPTESAAWVNARNGDGTFTNTTSFGAEEAYQIPADHTPLDPAGDLVVESDFDIVVDGGKITYQSGPRAGQVEIWDDGVTQKNPLARAMREAKDIHLAAAAKTGGKWSSNKSNTLVSILLLGDMQVFGQGIDDATIVLGVPKSGNDNYVEWGDAIANPNGIRLVIVGKSKAPQTNKPFFYGLQIRSNDQGTQYSGVSHLVLQNLTIMANESQGRAAILGFQGDYCGKLTCIGDHFTHKIRGTAGIGGWGGYSAKWLVRMHCIGGPYRFRKCGFTQAEEHALYLDSPQEGLEVYGCVSVIGTQSFGNTFLQVVNRAFDDDALRDPNQIQTARTDFLNGTKKLRYPGWGLMHIHYNVLRPTLNHSAVLSLSGFWGDVKVNNNVINNTDPSFFAEEFLVYANAQESHGVHLYTPNGGAWPATPGYHTRSVEFRDNIFRATNPGSNPVTITGAEKVIIGPNQVAVDPIRPHLVLEHSGSNVIQSSTASGGTDPYTTGEIFDLNGTVTQNTSYNYYISNDLFVGNPDGKVSISGLEYVTNDPRHQTSIFSRPARKGVHFTRDVIRPVSQHLTIHLPAIWGGLLAPSLVDEIWSYEGTIGPDPVGPPSALRALSISADQVSLQPVKEQEDTEVGGLLAAAGKTEAEILENFVDTLLALEVRGRREGWDEGIHAVLMALYRYAAMHWHYAKRKGL